MFGAARLNGLGRTSGVAAPATTRTAVTLTNTSITLNTSIFKYSPGSARFPSNAGPNLLTSDLGTFTGDFTIELFARLEDTSAGAGPIIQNYGYSGSTNSTGSFRMYFNSTTSAVLELNGQTALSFATNRFQFDHIAIVRQGSTVTLYRNGVTQGTRTWTQTLNANGQKFMYGYFGSGDALNGYMDELRFSNVARYSAVDFDFPQLITKPFVNDTHTRFLFHLDSTPFVDDNLVAVEPAFTFTDQVVGTTSISLVGSAAQAGDYAFYFDTSTTTTATNPSGWSTVNAVTTTGIRTAWHWKQLTSGDLTATHTGMGGTTRKVCVIYRSSVAISPETVSIASQATTAAPTNQTIRLINNIEPNIAFAVYATATQVATPTRGYTPGSPNESSNTTGSQGLWIKHLAYTRTNNPADVTVSMTDGGTNTLQTGIFRLV
jgi:hypothetical protein